MASAESMELNVISCRHLKAPFNFFRKLSVYAVVSIIIIKDKSSPQKQQQRQKTPVDRHGNGNPEWNHSLQFDVSDISPHHFVKFSLRSDGSVFGNKIIGEVCVQLMDLINEFDRVVRFVSYQVRTSDGKPNGVLNFSYKLLKKSASDVEAAAAAAEDEHLPPPSHGTYPSVDENLPPPSHGFYPCVDEHPPPSSRGLYPSVDVSTPGLYNMTPPPVHTVMPGAYYHAQFPWPPLMYDPSQPYSGQGPCKYPCAVGGACGWSSGGGVFMDFPPADQLATNAIAP